MFRPSKACCSRPPFAVPDEFSHHEGVVETHASTSIYITGSPTAKHGVLVIYDIFGFYPQTLHGADVLAKPSATSPRPYRVFVPDLFDGNGAPYECYPDDTPEKQATLEAFISDDGPGGIPKAVRRLKLVHKALAEANPDIASWALLDYCWGGYVASVLSAEQGRVEGRASEATSTSLGFVAVAQAHPGCAEAELARKITVPTLVLLSKDETEQEVKPMQENLAGPNKFETFADQIHGWTSARADLADPNVREAFDRAYRMIRAWFAEHMRD